MVFGLIVLLKLVDNRIIEGDVQFEFCKMLRTAPLIFFVITTVSLAQDATRVSSSEGLASELQSIGQSPTTIWQRLGVPQGLKRISKVRDGLINRRGNLPGLEMKPLLTKLSDAQNLESPVPAIRTAAKIKQQEDMARQKIKSIKYIARLGCGCYDKEGEITDALVASLDDCSELVRLVTVRELAEMSEAEACENCKCKSCCKPKLLRRLYEIAYGTDEYGCCKEPSERVRKVAIEAIQNCYPMSPNSVPLTDKEPESVPTLTDQIDDKELPDMDEEEAALQALESGETRESDGPEKQPEPSQALDESADIEEAAEDEDDEPRETETTRTNLPRSPAVIAQTNLAAVQRASTSHSNSNFLFDLSPDDTASKDEPQLFKIRTTPRPIEPNEYTDWEIVSRPTSNRSESPGIRDPWAVRSGSSARRR